MSQLADIKDNEKILRNNPHRFVLFPIEHHEIWWMYKKLEACFWTAEAIDLSNDIHDWSDRLNDDERYFISHALAFSATSGKVVNENLFRGFIGEVQIPEARCFYGFQNMMSNIHSETYSLLIDTYVKDPSQQADLFTAIETTHSIRTTADWILGWVQGRPATFAKRLIVFAAVKGIFSGGVFASIFWLKKRGLMAGLADSSELIFRDEGLYIEFACLIFSHLKNRPPKNVIQEVITQAVAAGHQLLTKALPCTLLGIDSTLMKQYIEYTADQLLSALGNDRYYNVITPFDFVENIPLTINRTGVSNCHRMEIMADTQKKRGSTSEHTASTFETDGYFSMNEEF